jgi:hypothetical protein
MVGLAGGVTTFDELPVTRACRVVYFHCELNPTEVKQRIIASVINVDTHGQFFNVRDIRAHLIDAEGRQFILETLTAHKPDIVVLDPWQELISGYNENDQKDTSLARSFINILIETFRCTVFLVQHTGNDESKGGRGHSGMKGWRDTLIKLSRHGENGVHVIVEPRWGEKVTFDLTFKDGTLNPAVTVGFTSQQLELRSFLKEKYPTGATPQQIADGLEMTPDACKKMIQRALKDDAVIKNDAGLICLKVKDATPTKGEGQ